MSDLLDLLPCPFCGGPASHTGAAIRCNSFACNASMSPRWTKDVVGSAKGNPDVQFALAKADCTKRWNGRAALDAGRLCISTVEMAECAAFSAGDLPQAAQDVLAERRRQVEAEGWTPEHDDEHSDGDMALAAAAYAVASTYPESALKYVTRPYHIDNIRRISDLWPWEVEWWKPSDRRRNLVKAGALILAEIERLDRAALAKGGA